MNRMESKDVFFTSIKHAMLGKESIKAWKKATLREYLKEGNSSYLLDTNWELILLIIFQLNINLCVRAIETKHIFVA